MKKRLLYLSILVVVLGLLVSCNLPLIQPQTPPEGTPNMTLTAFFDTSFNIPPTITPAQPGAEVSPTAALNPTSTVVTNTPIPTFTSQPTILLPTQLTPTRTNTPGVKQRGGKLMKAAYLDTTPVMDGTYAEWVEDTYKYAIPYVVFQPKNWTGMEDLEGAFAAGWDNKYLYISVKVTDDVFAQNRSGEMMYQGDSVEVLIDADLAGDFSSSELTKDDYQIGISPGNPDKGIKPEVYFWYPTGSKGTQAKVLVASLFESNPIYRVEVGIPWSLLGITPEKGLRIGFAVSVNDNDKPAENLQQTMISTAQYRNFLDPTTWGELVLEK